jgi:hypothetical protein
MSNTRIQIQQILLPSRPKALSGANVAIFTSFFAIAAAPAIASCEELLTLAVLPLAEEYEKIMVVEPAVADSITGKNWNKYFLFF